MAVAARSAAGRRGCLRGENSAYTGTLHCQRTIVTEDPLQALYRRPGFLIRRAHQIAVSLFMAEMDGLGITKTQYGILFILKHRPGLSQITVAKLLGLDRSTTSMVVKKLEDSGFVALEPDPNDLRQSTLTLTAAGKDMLKRLAEPVRRAERSVLGAFTPDEQAQFLALLDKFTRTFNAETRVPIVPLAQAATTPPAARARKRPAVVASNASGSVRRSRKSGG
jgi:DNA-binding MarR family transcriptional regulator